MGYYGLVVTGGYYYLVVTSGYRYLVEHCWDTIT